jgi:hypothetical protein
MTRSKAKGTAAEVALVGALQRLGWPHAERRALSGIYDKGDTTGHPGLVFECKDAKTWNAAAWMRETEVERVNAKADYGILVVKVPGIGYPNAEKWLTVMDDMAAYSLYNQSNLGHAYPLTPPHLIRSVETKAIGIAKGVVVMAERERHCGATPVMVRVKRHGEPGFYNLMRLGARCKLLVDAGYGGYAIMDVATSDTMKEHDGG